MGLICIKIQALLAVGTKCWLRVQKIKANAETFLFLFWSLLLYTMAERQAGEMPTEKGWG